MKILTFDGRLVRDAELNQTNTGVRYLRFSVANDSKKQNSVVTEWYDVVVFDENIVSKMQQYLTKGSYVLITGEPTTSISVKDGQAYLNQRIRAFSVNFGGGKSNNNTSGSTQASPAPQYAPPVNAAPVAQPQPQPATPVIPMPHAAPVQGASQVPPVQQFAPQPQVPPVQPSPVQPSPAYSSPASSVDDDLPF